MDVTSEISFGFINGCLMTNANHIQVLPTFSKSYHYRLL